MREKSNSWLAAMAIYVRFRMRRAFHDVIGSGLETARDTLDSGPAIIVMNHVAWWDPLFLILLNQRLESDGYALMAADSLEELPFFSRLGALPLHRGRARLALADLERAASLLDRRRRFVAIFPSGQQRPSHFPLSFQSGVHRLHRGSAARLIPLALRYEFLESPRPTLFYSLGEPFELPDHGSPKEMIALVEGRVHGELFRIDRAISEVLAYPSDPPHQLASLIFSSPRPPRAGRVPCVARFFGLGAASAPRLPSRLP